MKYIFPLVTALVVTSACATAKKNLVAEHPASSQNADTKNEKQTADLDKVKLAGAAATPSKDMFGQSEMTGLKIVHFEFDKSDLTDEDRKALEMDSEYLQSHPNQKIMVEGHCDERGSAEYNMALGERRAKAVRDYLTLLGVDHSRMEIISYGSEQPIDNDHNEEAWSLNRRAQFRSLQ